MVKADEIITCQQRGDQHHPLWLRVEHGDHLGYDTQLHGQGEGDPHSGEGRGHHHDNREQAHHGDGGALKVDG